MLALPGQAPTRVDLMVEFEQPLLERGGTIEAVGDLGEAMARRRIDATGLYIVPFAPPGASVEDRRKAFGPGVPAYFHLSRDPQGQEVVWTLAGDVDPATPSLP